MISNIMMVKILKDEAGKLKFVFDEDIINVVVGKGLKIIIIALIMYIVIKTGNKLIQRFVEHQGKSKLSFSLNEQKAVTLGEVLKSALKYAVYFIGVAMMLSGIFNGLSVALAGIGGVAIGLGVQSLVKDIINGFFILFEDQFGVGDHVTIDRFEGIVESIGIRTTIIRDFSGDVHLIPNGHITIVTNHSRGDIRFIVDVEIAYEENIDEAINVIEKVNSEFAKENSEEIRGPIEVLGVNSLNGSGVTIRVIGRSKPLSQWKMERELRKAIKVALDQAKIEIPYPKTVIVNEDDKNN